MHGAWNYPHTTTICTMVWDNAFHIKTLMESIFLIRYLGVRGKILMVELGGKSDLIADNLLAYVKLLPSGSETITSETKYQLCQFELDQKAPICFSPHGW